MVSIGTEKPHYKNLSRTCERFFDAATVIYFFFGGFFEPVVNGM